MNNIAQKNGYKYTIIERANPMLAMIGYDYQGF